MASSTMRLSGLISGMDTLTRHPFYARLHSHIQEVRN